MELSAPMEVDGVAEAVWCSACREIVPAFVLGGRKAVCAAHERLGHGRPAMPLGGPLDDADN